MTAHQNKFVKRLNKLRQAMREQNVDMYLVLTEDYHNSEYVHDYFKVREYLTGFTGSNGTLLVTMDEALLWTDGRYFIQAERELAGSQIRLCKSQEPGVPTVEQYLEAHIETNQVLGVDGSCISYEYSLKLDEALYKKGAKFQYKVDLAGKIWQLDREEKRSQLPCEKVFFLDESYTGESVTQTIEKVRQQIKVQGCRGLVLSKLDDVMWLYHLRGSDIECNPVALSYAVITLENAYLFLQPEAVNESVREIMKAQSVTILPYDSFFSFVKDLPKDEKVMAAKEEISCLLGRLLVERTDGFIDNNPITLLKAVKSITEIQNSREIYIKDSAAVTKFIYWLKDTIGKEPLTELKAAKYLDDLRKQIPEFINFSFPTISAYASNAAMMHYQADEKSNAQLESKGMLLVDSGGQYYGGTTDVTRTIILGEISAVQKQHFTAAAIGMLRLANTQFLYGCTGRNLDILAREPLWRLGVDYKCGTGHGIGYMLNVHEGPQRISYHYSHGAKEAILEEGMFVSDEPGAYVEGEYGIRTENVLLCQKADKVLSNQFMCFETLTFVPIDREGIEIEMLTAGDRENLNRYHEAVYEKISPFLTGNEREWLKEATAPI